MDFKVKAKEASDNLHDCFVIRPGETCEVHWSQPATSKVKGILYLACVVDIPELPFNSSFSTEASSTACLILGTRGDLVWWGDSHDGSKKLLGLSLMAHPNYEIGTWVWIDVYDPDKVKPDYSGQKKVPKPLPFD